MTFAIFVPIVFARPDFRKAAADDEHAEKHQHVAVVIPATIP
jgi:hypothetical protein